MGMLAYAHDEAKAAGWNVEFVAEKTGQPVKIILRDRKPKLVVNRWFGTPDQIAGVMLGTVEMFALAQNYFEERESNLIRFPLFAIAS